MVDLWPVYINTQGVEIGARLRAAGEPVGFLNPTEFGVRFVRGDIPLNEFFDGICLAVAGALLMTPGFFTDAIGFSLLVPPVRTWLRHYLAARFDVTDAGMPGADFTARRDTTIIEAEYERLDEQDKP